MTGFFAVSFFDTAADAVDRRLSSMAFCRGLSSSDSYPPVPPDVCGPRNPIQDCFFFSLQLKQMQNEPIFVPDDAGFVG